MPPRGSVRADDRGRDRDDQRYVDAVRRYLQGQTVPFASLFDWQFERDLGTIQLGNAPADSQLR